MVALAFVEWDRDRKIIDPVSTPDPFPATCILCGTTNPYAKYEVTPWEGPLPSPDFQPNSAFVPAEKK
jgi:hypothetical protein